MARREGCASRPLPAARPPATAIRGVSWKSDGALVDPRGQIVEFSILTSSSNAQRTQIATIVQNDLSQLGMSVQVVPLDFRAMVDRLLNTHNLRGRRHGIVTAMPIRLRK